MIFLTEITDMAGTSENEESKLISRPDPSLDSSASERAWVRTLEPGIKAFLPDAETMECRSEVCTGYRLPYTCEILGYHDDGDEPLSPKSQRYETDLLIYDVLRDGSGWVPRVVIECKLGSVTTHDALTYSTKAKTHKHVHPYLRYGILIGAFGPALPPRLVRHGAYFDFMTVWNDREPKDDEWSVLRGVLLDEIKAARLLQQVLTQRNRGGKKYRLLHRRLYHLDVNE
jgi:hypothetical protein